MQDLCPSTFCLFHNRRRCRHIAKSRCRAQMIVMWVWIVLCIHIYIMRQKDGLFAHPFRTGSRIHHTGFRFECAQYICTDMRGRSHSSLANICVIWCGHKAELGALCMASIWLWHHRWQQWNDNDISNVRNLTGDVCAVNSRIVWAHLLAFRSKPTEYRKSFNTLPPNDKVFF